MDVEGAQDVDERLEAANEDFGAAAAIRNQEQDQDVMEQQQLQQNSNHVKQGQDDTGGNGISGMQQPQMGAAEGGEGGI